jgi:hypothetical protein
MNSALTCDYTGIFARMARVFQSLLKGKALKQSR